MSENISKANENDYTPVNKYIDEQSRLRRAKSFRMNAISWALLLIAIGLLAVLLAWAYSLLDRNYVLKRVAGVQEQVIQEKINEAISSSGISDSVEDLKMLGNNQMAIDKLNEAEEALKDEKDKNQSLSKKNQALSDQKKKHTKTASERVRGAPGTTKNRARIDPGRLRGDLGRSGGFRHPRCSGATSECREGRLGCSA